MSTDTPVRVLALLLTAVLLSPLMAGAPQRTSPKQPLEEIVQHFAQKEEEYATAHSRYRYRLSVKVQEIDEDGDVEGEFEQVSDVDFDPRGRRRATPVSNPRVDLRHLDIKRVELSDLEFVPLFVMKVEDIPKYDITYLSQEKVDEVNTYLFRLQPKGVPRFPDQLFEGIVWIDVEKLDVVRALGRLLPVRETGAFNGYFRRLEIFREPVDDYLFSTFIRADDVISVRERPTRARLVLRFTDHQRLDQPQKTSDQ